MPVPKFFIRANGIDITDRLSGSGMSMSIIDGLDMEADTLELVIDDVDGSVIAPKTGAVLNPVGGYEGQMRDFGLYVVEQIVFSGWPQQISIQANSIEAKSLSKQRDPKAYSKREYPTYGDIFAEVAGRVGLNLQISSSIRAQANEYEAQTEESAIEFMIRIGDKLNASVSVKSGHLCVVERGEGKAASGQPLREVPVETGRNMINYSVTEKDQPKHSEVEASYYDRKKNKKETVKKTTGLDGPKFTIRAPYQGRGDAERAAQAQAKKLARDTREASFEIDGEPFAQAGAIAAVRGARSNVDGRWLIDTVTHNFSASGPYTTSLSCKAPNT